MKEPELFGIADENTSYWNWNLVPDTFYLVTDGGTNLWPKSFITNRVAS